jgi:hypothetical protein
VQQGRREGGLGGGAAAGRLCRLSGGLKREDEAGGVDHESVQLEVANGSDLHISGSGGGGGGEALFTITKGGVRERETIAELRAQKAALEAQLAAANSMICQLQQEVRAHRSASCDADSRRSPMPIVTRPGGAAEEGHA